MSDFLWDGGEEKSRISVLVCVGGSQWARGLAVTHRFLASGWSERGVRKLRGASPFCSAPPPNQSARRRHMTHQRTPPPPTPLENYFAKITSLFQATLGLKYFIRLYKVSEIRNIIFIIKLINFMFICTMKLQNFCKRHFFIDFALNWRTSDWLSIKDVSENLKFCMQIEALNLIF